MKKYDRKIHISDSQEKYYDAFIVVKKTEKFYGDKSRARADVITRELVYTNFGLAVSEYLAQCERAWQDISYAEKHHQDAIIVHTIALQAINNTGYINADSEDEGEYIPDTFRSATYRYTNEE